jgi:hypothetical protein
MALSQQAQNHKDVVAGGAFDQVLSKNTDHNLSEQVVSSLVRSLLLESVWPCRTFSDEPHVHRSKPQLKFVNPSLVNSIKTLWFQMCRKTRNQKRPMKVLDCWS